jgi:hypothetical protein
VSRVRAFGEDLFREFSRSEQAVLTLGEVDSAKNQLSLTLTSNKHAGSVVRFINKQLVRHNLADIAHISKLELKLEVYELTSDELLKRRMKDQAIAYVQSVLRRMEESLNDPNIPAAKIRMEKILEELKLSPSAPD